MSNPFEKIKDIKISWPKGSQRPSSSFSSFDPIETLKPFAERLSEIRKQFPQWRQEVQPTPEPYVTEEYSDDPEPTGESRPQQIIHKTVYMPMPTAPQPAHMPKFIGSFKTKADLPSIDENKVASGDSAYIQDTGELVYVE